jgi:hypothetical protein
MLYSFKTLDLPGKGEEAPLVPQAQGNVILASNLNRKSQLDQVYLFCKLNMIFRPPTGELWRYLKSSSHSNQNLK